MLTRDYRSNSTTFRARKRIPMLMTEFISNFHILMCSRLTIANIALKPDQRRPLAITERNESPSSWPARNSPTMRLLKQNTVYKPSILFYCILFNCEWSWWLREADAQAAHQIQFNFIQFYTIQSASSVKIVAPGQDKGIHEKWFEDKKRHSWCGPLSLAGSNFEDKFWGACWICVL